GTPLVMDIFHGDRWDYIYRTAPGGRVAEEKKLTVFFQDYRLSHIQGDFPQPPAFSESEPAPNFFSPEQTFTPAPDTDGNMNEEPDKKGTINFLKKNQTNFYKDNQ
ncbi:MAG: outer membrane protein assembly factor BamE, partial [Nitrosomonas sp.]|nr:outer membrane protein assembly factor BamE [Nitrosomonas sp.]